MSNGSAITSPPGPDAQPSSEIRLLTIGVRIVTPPLYSFLDFTLDDRQGADSSARSLRVWLTSSRRDRISVRSVAASDTAGQGRPLP